jgi:hypothetical protein
LGEDLEATQDYLNVFLRHIAKAPDKTAILLMVEGGETLIIINTVSVSPLMIVTLTANVADVYMEMDRKLDPQS